MPARMALYDKASGIAASIGLDLPHGSAGGGSDGNFTGAMGIPTLDGLGVRGADPHTLNEHIDSRQPRRARPPDGGSVGDAGLRAALAMAKASNPSRAIPFKTIRARAEKRKGGAKALAKAAAAQAEYEGAGQTRRRSHSGGDDASGCFPPALPGA